MNLGNQSATMTWNSTAFLPNSGTTSATLILGSQWCDSTIDFQNPIYLGNAARTVQVNVGSGTVAVDAKLSGVLSGGGSLTVAGDGALALTASNIFSGGVTIDDATLCVQNGSALGSGGVTLYGGTLRIAASTAISNAVSLSADSTIDVTGGRPARWATLPSAATRST